MSYLAHQMEVSHCLIKKWTTLNYPPKTPNISQNKNKESRTIVIAQNDRLLISLASSVWLHIAGG